MRVILQETAPHTYCPRALIADDQGQTLASISWTAGYGDPNEPARRAQCIALARQFAGSGEALSALAKAEAFIAGFEGDETQEGVSALLAEIRAALAVAPYPQR